VVITNDDEDELEEIETKNVKIFVSPLSLTPERARALVNSRPARAATSESEESTDPVDADTKTEEEQPTDVDMPVGEGVDTEVEDAGAAAREGSPLEGEEEEGLFTSEGSPLTIRNKPVRTREDDEREDSPYRAPKPTTPRHESSVGIAQDAGESPEASVEDPTPTPSTSSRLLSAASALFTPSKLIEVISTPGKSLMRLSIAPVQPPEDEPSEETEEELTQGSAQEPTAAPEEPTQEPTSAPEEPENLVAQPMILDEEDPKESEEPQLPTEAEDEDSSEEGVATASGLTSAFRTFVDTPIKLLRKIVRGREPEDGEGASTEPQEEFAPSDVVEGEPEVIATEEPEEKSEEENPEVGEGSREDTTEEKSAVEEEGVAPEPKLSLSQRIRATPSKLYLGPKRIEASSSSSIDIGEGFEDETTFDVTAMVGSSEGQESGEGEVVGEGEGAAGLAGKAPEPSIFQTLVATPGRAMRALGFTRDTREEEKDTERNPEEQAPLVEEVEEPREAVQEPEIQAPEEVGEEKVEEDQGEEAVIREAEGSGEARDFGEVEGSGEGERAISLVGAFLNAARDTPRKTKEFISRTPRKAKELVDQIYVRPAPPKQDEEETTDEDLYVEDEPKIVEEPQVGEEVVDGEVGPTDESAPAEDVVPNVGGEAPEEAVAPEAVAPEAVAPEAVAPEAVAPEAVAPEAVAPEAVAPEAVAPEAEGQEKEQEFPTETEAEVETNDGADADAEAEEAKPPQAPPTFSIIRSTPKKFLDLGRRIRVAPRKAPLDELSSFEEPTVEDEEEGKDQPTVVPEVVVVVEEEREAKEGPREKVGKTFFQLTNFRPVANVGSSSSASLQDDFGEEEEAPVVPEAQPPTRVATLKRPRDGEEDEKEAKKAKKNETKKRPREIGEGEDEASEPRNKKIKLTPTDTGAGVGLFPPSSPPVPSVDPMSVPHEGETTAPQTAVPSVPKEAKGVAEYVEKVDSAHAWWGPEKPEDHSPPVFPHSPSYSFLFLPLPSFSPLTQTRRLKNCL
jgi:hypothetical protein